MGRHPTQAAYGGKRWQLSCRVLERGGRSAIERTSLRPLRANSGPSATTASDPTRTVESLQSRRSTVHMTGRRRAACREHRNSNCAWDGCTLAEDLYPRRRPWHQIALRGRQE